MSIDYRNQAIARVAFAVASSDGEVAEHERQALEAFLERFPTVFDAFDRNDILAYFDNFRLHLTNYRRKHEVIDDWRIRNLTGYVFSNDLPPIAELLDVLALADGHLHPDEASLVSRIRSFVAQRLDQGQAEADGAPDPDDA